MTQQPKRRRRPIYVESLIKSSMERLWEATQDPSLHQRWDLRFSEINYLPLRDDEPQQFTYATQVFPGVVVAGTGESLGDRDRADGSRWSGLKFWTADRRAIIDAGAGYWRYLPTDDGIRFLTRYDYRPRWGAIGEVIDRIMFRPIFGWATAWSFDRLRLWLDEGVPPERARDLTIAHAVAVGGLAGVFAYQGLVPKVWKVDPGELALWEGVGVPASLSKVLVRSVGAGEALFAVVLVARSSSRWPFVVSLLAMPALTAGAAISNRKVLSEAFNPASLGIAVSGLAIVALATHEGRPSARRTMRVAPDRQPDVGDLP